MSITELFERKFLFGLGRHLWNVVGVSGFISLLTGIILFVNSSFYESAKSKENFFGKRKLITAEKIENATKELLPYEDWIEIKDSKNSVKLLSLQEWSKEKGIAVPDVSTKKGKELKQEYLNYQDEFIDGPATNLWDKYFEYKEPFLLKEKALLNEKVEQEDKYDNYLDQVRYRNEVKKGQAVASPFVMGYGLAVIASASISSAVLSIERNSREK